MMREPSWSIAISVITVVLIVGLASASAASTLRVKWKYNVTQIGEKGFKWSVLVLADLDGDGKQEAICATENRMVAVKVPGKLMWSFPPPGEEAISKINKVASVDDIDGDGKPEVLFAAGKPPNGAVYCLNWDGSLKWKWSDPDASFKYGGTKAYDIDGDGSKEVIAVGADAKVYVLSNTGELKWSRLLPPGRACDDMVNTFDVDRDGEVEILAESRESGDMTEKGAAPGKLYCLSPTGIEKWSWQSGKWTDFMHGQPIVADVNGDGEYEIITNLWNCDSDDFGGIVVINFYGSTVAEKQLLDYSPHSAMVGDIDGDGKMEILVGDWKKYYCFNPDLSEKWSFNYSKVIGNVRKPLNMGAALGDVTGDGKIDVVVQSRYNSTIFVLDNHGKLEASYNFPERSTNSVAIGDVDGDGKSEIVACAGTTMYCLTMDGAYNPATFIWPQYGRDAAHSGVIPITEPAVAVLGLLFLAGLRYLRK